MVSIPLKFWIRFVIAMFSAFKDYFLYTHLLKGVSMQILEVELKYVKALLWLL